MRETLRILLATVLIVGASSRGLAGTNVTGIVVDETGKPLEGVSCLLAGTPTDKSGNRIVFSGIPVPIFTDKEGKFSISPPPECLADIQFDEGNHAPIFLCAIAPEASPLRVVMIEGKVLRGRIVDKQHAPIAFAEVELQMGQSDRWYQKKGISDRNGEFQFRVSEPPQKSPWMLYFAGERLEIDYSKVIAGTVFTLQSDVRMSVETETGGATADGSQSIHPETNATSQ